MLERIQIQRTNDGQFFRCHVAVDGVAAEPFWVDCASFIEAERQDRLDRLLEETGRAMNEQQVS